MNRCVDIINGVSPLVSNLGRTAAWPFCRCPLFQATWRQSCLRRLVTSYYHPVVMAHDDDIVDVQFVGNNQQNFTDDAVKMLKAVLPATFDVVGFAGDAMASSKFRGAMSAWSELARVRLGYLRLHVSRPGTRTVYDKKN